MSGASGDGRAGRRLECIYAISRLLTMFEGVDRTVPEALRLLNGVLPLSSAILIEGRSGRLRKVVWHALSATPAALLRAETNASAAYTCLTGPIPASAHPIDVERVPARLADPSTAKRILDERGGRNFITLPLAIDRGAIFGAFQVEGAYPLAEGDLPFVGAIVDQLAVAIDRRHALASRGFAEAAGAWRR